VAMWSADVLIGVAGLLLLWAGTNEISLSPRALWGRLVANRAISARESATE